jgi:hypothetical protein
VTDETTTTTAETTTSETPPAENLIDAAKAANPAATTTTETATEWFWSDGVKGTEKPPDWFDGKKYKSVAEQAKAYPEARRELDGLRTKLKGFAGAPEKYELTVPEDLQDKLEWLPDDPLLGQFQTLAKEAGMSQQVFEQVLHTFAQYEYANMMPDWAKEKTALGERADERLNGFWDWAGANFDEQTAMTVKRALGIAPSPAEIFMALEAVQNAGRQPPLHKHDETAAGALTLADVDRLQADPRFGTDPAYRAEVRAKRAQVVGTGDHKVIIGGARKAS